MNGLKAILYYRGVAVGGATSAVVNIEQNAEEMEYLSTNGGGWKFQQAGKVSWTVSHSGFFVEKALEDALYSMIANVALEGDIWLKLGDSGQYLKGHVHIANVTIDASVGSLMKVSCSLKGEGIPYID